MTKTNYLFNNKENQLILSSKILERLDELNALEAGWISGNKDNEELPIDFELLGSVKEDLAIILNGTKLSSPRIYPTQESGVSAEWTINDNHFEIEWFDSEYSATIFGKELKFKDFTKDSISELIDWINLEVL